LPPVLDAVEVRRKFIGHLLQCQALCQPEHPLIAVIEKVNGSAMPSQDRHRGGQYI
jgi:hypothetical protein